MLFLVAWHVAGIASGCDCTGALLIGLPGFTEFQRNTSTSHVIFLCPSQPLSPVLKFFLFSMKSSRRLWAGHNFSFLGTGHCWRKSGLHNHPVLWIPKPNLICHNHFEWIDHNVLVHAIFQTRPQFEWCKSE